jgi:L-lactate dehydrogenase complex protein LldF
MERIRLKENVKKSLKDERLKRALKNALPHFRENRKKALSEIENWESLREEASGIKEMTLNNLSYYLDILEKKIEERGGVVHRAKDGREAREIIGDLVRDYGIRKVVKGKSMVTEEIELNRYLENMGIEVTETDLGEFIIQLSGEPPSHIIAPAVHRTREEVRKLLKENFGIEPGESIEELAATARKILRKKFLKADMGITGVNFAVAETGTLVILENEGNIRMSTTFPKVHLAIMGMEKVLPRFVDLSIFLTLLPRSATGQRMTSYVSFIDGPKKKDERDGAHHFHLIILDNGRSLILDNPDFREILKCVRCGACINICPIYEIVGGHAYGWVYPGPVGICLTPLLLGYKRGGELPFLSTLCNACKEVCPVKIDLPKIILKLRNEMVRNKYSPGHPKFMEKFLMKVWKKTFSNPVIYDMLTKTARYSLKLLSREGWIGKIFPLKWTKYRDFPLISPRELRGVRRVKNGNRKIY